MCRSTHPRWKALLWWTPRALSGSSYRSVQTYKPVRSGLAVPQCCACLDPSRWERTSWRSAPPLSRCLSLLLLCLVDLSNCSIMHPLVCHRVFNFFVPCDLCWVGLQAGTPVKPSAMVTTVQILALPVLLGVRSNAKMLPSFLRCFPNLKRLHIHVRLRT